MNIHTYILRMLQQNEKKETEDREAKTSGSSCSLAPEREAAISHHLPDWHGFPTCGSRGTSCSHRRGCTRQAEQHVPERSATACYCYKSLCNFASSRLQVRYGAFLGTATGNLDELLHRVVTSR